MYPKRSQLARLPFLNWQRTTNGKFTIRAYNLVHPLIHGKKYNCNGICAVFLGYHLPTSTTPGHTVERNLPIAMFPPNTTVDVPTDMEDNPTYASTEVLIQVKLP